MITTIQPYRTDNRMDEYVTMRHIKVKAARKAEGWNERTLAEKSGVSEQTIRNIESPDYPGVTHKTVAIGVAIALGLPIWKLFGPGETGWRGRSAGAVESTTHYEIEATPSTTTLTETTVTTVTNTRYCPKCNLEMPATRICDRDDCQ